MRRSFSRVSVIGLGYIGLPTAAVLASHGIEVIGVDVNSNVVETISQGRIHIVEPDLDAVVHHVVKSGKLRPTTVPEPAEAFIVSVPTPFKGDHAPDISYVEVAVHSIAPVLSKGCLLVLESTCPVGTTEHVASMLSKMRTDLSFPSLGGEIECDVNVAYCPERVLPGNVLYELSRNDRVIGGMTRRCTERATMLYEMFVKGKCLATDARTAEMVKLTENAFRDVNIAFANELSLICDRLGISVWELIRLANHHPRVNILKPGPGVGGHCIAVDPWFIVHSAPEQARLIRTAREVNNFKPHHVLQMIRDAVVSSSAHSPVIACLGLSFKADIDDLRESPALEIVAEIVREKLGRVLIVEPHIPEIPQSLRKNGVELVTLDAAVGRADVVVVLVDHKAFNDVKQMDMSRKIVIDTRGLLANRQNATAA